MDKPAPARINKFIEEYRTVFEDGLADLLDSNTGLTPGRLFESMAYSLKAGGKRIRPILALAAAERCGVHPKKAMPIAMAYEMIHTASLILDDLPAMDNDDYRRGKPTNHKVYGEPVALLAGNCMMVWAFEHALTMLRELGNDPDKSCRSVLLLMEAAGMEGIGGGQTLDIDPLSASPDPDFVREIAYSKTAVLIRGAIVSGAMLGDVTDSELQCYYDYGTHLGMAFQIVDDVLDVTGTKEELGKTPRKDTEQGKITFVSSYGLEEAMKMAVNESELAVKALEPIFPEGDSLIDLARYLADRIN